MSSPARAGTVSGSKFLSLGLLAVLMTACAEAELVESVVLEVAAHLESASGQTTRPAYIVGAPYEIAGTWYYPAEDYSYTAQGVASIYGSAFQGKRTANGEPFDNNRISAAHRTLPMPSIVRVINLANGRSIQVRINDRGPLEKDRILVVSRRGAQLLGFGSEGTARVRIEIDPGASQRLKQQILTGSDHSDGRVTTGQGSGPQTGWNRALDPLQHGGDTRLDQGGLLTWTGCPGAPRQQDVRGRPCDRRSEGTGYQSVFRIPACGQPPAHACRAGPSRDPTDVMIPGIAMTSGIGHVLGETARGP